jgi:large subunit ribosomal protein L18e
VRKPKTTNPQLLELISCLKKQSRESKVGIWRDAAERLSKHRRQRIVVNLSCLNRYTEKSETVIVPGKVLASGEISHPITIAAFAFSGKAKEKIMAARGKCLSFAELIKKNPTGSNIRIIG